MDAAGGVGYRRRDLLDGGTCLQDACAALSSQFGCLGGFPGRFMGAVGDMVGTDRQLLHGCRH
ncbi:hypothetical protein SDC9_190008 [bioreactor metagenome]|uniref:Uncharacterized protein n=1 Tax=bioreactor metagenome TaxID=1076179 RepID=A0A645HTS9_9ZZZZ